MTEIEQIQKLTEGYSSQAKVSNQFWLVLIIACLIVITGRAEDGLIELPFALGKVKPSQFYLINNILVSILIIAYISAMIQTMRTRMLIQRGIEDLKTRKNNEVIGSVHIQDFVDSMITPTYNRVAPIAQFLQGNKQFLEDGKANFFIQIFSSLLYILLKLASYFFIYAIPVYTMLLTADKLNFTQINDPILNPYWLELFVYLLNKLTFLSIIILIIGDLIFLRKSLLRIWSK